MSTLKNRVAITLDGCDRILETAMKSGAKLMVGHNMRYMPAVVRMKEIIDSGVIGEVRCVWVRPFRELRLALISGTGAQNGRTAPDSCFRRGRMILM